MLSTVVNWNLIHTFIQQRYMCLAFAIDAFAESWKTE